MKKVAEILISITRTKAKTKELFFCRAKIPPIMYIVIRP